MLIYKKNWFDFIIIVAKSVFASGNRFFEAEFSEYDSFSVEPIIWVRRGHESESGQMVLKKVKLTYFDAYLCQTMWNHAKKSMEESKHSDSVFLQWDCAENAKKTQKL